MPPTALKTLTAAQSALFKPTVASTVRAISLVELGVDAGDLKPLTYAGGNACIMTNVYQPLGVELYHEHEKMHLSRWPDLSVPVARSNWASVMIANSSGLPLNKTIQAAIGFPADSVAQVASWKKQVEGGGQLYTHGLWMVHRIPAPAVHSIP